MTEKNHNNFEILESIGKGGMGEVFLAYDKVCGRHVALKQMGKQWIDNVTMRERFLREAKIAAQLSHPNIIPIYTIDKSAPFYTMPRIEGETLKEIFRKTKEQTTTGKPLHHIGASIPALIRIFLNVCSAIAYVHSRGILHRDLKPENIIVGKYGEVIILDWGLANFIDEPEKNGLDLPLESSQLTLPGKIPGTILYMAPERAFGQKSTPLTDIYSLGVILYQSLTLQFPFQRKSVKEFRKFFKHEKILDPQEAAPDRDIPPYLSNIVKKCLAEDPKHRYQNVTELIKDLESYIEGLPEWIESEILHVDKKEDWQFQENIALAKHMALTREVETLEWVNLMISQSLFPGNIKIETHLILKEKSQGLGILFCIPKQSFHKSLEEGYCLWLSSEGIHLYRLNVEVLHHPQIQLEKGKSYHISIEHIDHRVRLFIDGIQKFEFLSHIPMSGSCIGLLLRDGDFSLSPLKLAVGSQNIMVNCLAVPDAFLGRGDFDDALKEYRKISSSFPGRAEGREATFRAGLTLLKKAANQKQKKHREEIYQDALDEFEKLHQTPGAPFEYLGKSLVYKAQNDHEEEAKYLELALRKFSKHPLKPILVENILSRLHESSQHHRKAAYLFSLIILRHLSHLPDAQIIGSLLKKNLEPLPFFTPSEDQNQQLIIELAFWLNKPLVLYELIEKGLSPIANQNSQIGLILLGVEDLADLSVLKNPSPAIEYAQFEYALKIQKDPLPPKLPLWVALEEKKWDQAANIIQTIPHETLLDEKDPHFFLYGCFLAHEKGEKAALEHLTNISEKAFPQTSALLSHYLMGRINLKKGWIENAFFWEKLKLFQQITLYGQCLGDEKLKKKGSQLLKTLTTL